MDEAPHPIPAGRIAQLWAWLPAFRLVAETENLRVAAEMLHLTPSALSRTIRLLEDALDLPLFDRVGRNLRLNENGRMLLRRTRDAMRGVDEGLRDLYESHFNSDVRVSSVGIGPRFVLPALTALRARHPNVRPRHLTLSAEKVGAALSTGQLDVAFHESALAMHHLTVERLADVDNAVYCGRGHALYRRRSVALEDVLKQEFVAPPTEDGAQAPDQWPVETPRRVAIIVDSLLHGRELCASGRFLAVLPTCFEVEGLRRLPGPDLPSTSLYAVRRRPLSEVDAVSVLIDLVKVELEGWRGS